MTKRIAVKDIPEFCPKWGEIVQSFTPEGEAYDISVGDIVSLQFVKYGDIESAIVKKIVADKETHEAAEVTVIMQGNHKQWRTVTPEKIWIEGKQRMKVKKFSGELPKRTGGGRVRADNPFDGLIAKGGSHQVDLDEGDDSDTIKKQIRAAAAYAKKSVRVADGDKGVILFLVTERKPRATADADS